MKIAIVCDWLVVVGGAEKFLGHLLQCYPNADLYAVIDFIDADKRHFLQGKTIKTTFMQKLPFVRTHYRSYLPLMTIAIEQLDVSAYDLVISSSHAVAKGILTSPHQVHISYVHSPMRYAWDLQHQYLREAGLASKTQLNRETGLNVDPHHSNLISRFVRGAQGMLARYFLHKLRIWDVRSAHGVDHFVANSHFIARRIAKTYRREATVIYPPIEIEKFLPVKQKSDFYLAVSRLVPYKRIDLIVESFSHMTDKKLYVIGDGPDFEKIKNRASKNVEMLGYQPNDVLIDHMQRAKALIFAAEEDFGLVPLEAQACGTPVIAYGRGGALETIRGLDCPRPTGLFFPTQTTEAICQAVLHFEANYSRFTVENCVDQAARFAPQVFYSSFKAFVAEKVRGPKENRSG